MRCRSDNIHPGQTAATNDVAQRQRICLDKKNKKTNKRAVLSSESSKPSVRVVNKKERERCAPSPEKFLILALNMVSFGAFSMVFFYSSPTCFTRKTGVQPLYAYKSRDGE